MAPAPPADVRVYLFTYRRNNLLTRALESLLGQTHTRWVCELHNDDPGDPFPGQLVEKINDPRVTYVRHDHNLGPTGAFNLAFRPVSDPFISILEDDNWWEPDCLARLLSTMTGNPCVHLAWVNMRKWMETEDGGWEKGGTIWPVEPGLDIIQFEVPDPRQACAALHSQGAMLVRVSPVTMISVPVSLPVFAIEPVRERSYPGPMLLLTEPLANFAITRNTWRRESADDNLGVLVLLAQTFLARSDFPDVFYQRMWAACRGSRGHKHRALMVAAILTGRLFRVLKGARIGDVAVVASWALRHPVRFARLFMARARFPEVFAFLDAAARARLADFSTCRGSNG